MLFLESKSITQTPFKAVKAVHSISCEGGPILPIEVKMKVDTINDSKGTERAFQGHSPT